jgi:UDP-2,3-diacylglucosamine hydrolase
LIELKKGKKIYFASDNHLGAPSREKSLEREKIFVKWLDEIKNDACEIFLLGDLFDFWIEYNEVVPKGFVRVLGKLAQISDSGVQINFFVGNHDLWTKDYFQKELGIRVYKKSTHFSFNNHLFFVGHGDEHSDTQK